MEPYSVPFTFERSDAPRFRLRNDGDETLRGVTVTLLGCGVMPAAPPRVLRPGEQVEVVIRGGDLARATSLVIRWLRPDGGEYLWRVAF